jgi:hypothetical protein
VLVTLQDQAVEDLSGFRILDTVQVFRKMVCVIDANLRPSPLSLRISLLVIARVTGLDGLNNEVFSEE